MKEGRKYLIHYLFTENKEAREDYGIIKSLKRPTYQRARQYLQSKLRLNDHTKRREIQKIIALFDY